MNRPGFVGDFILWKRGWSHGQTRQGVMQGLVTSNM